MADFTKYTNYTENTSFSGVIFGGNAPVLEVELNEIQEIQNTKIRRIMQSIGDGVFITPNGSITLSDTTVTVTNCAIISEGFLAFIDEASVTVTDENDHVYFTLQESTATSSDTLYDYGNVNGNTIPNPIADSRVGAETSRRKLVSVTLNAGDSFPSSSSSVGNIPVCIYENNDITLKAYSDSIIGMINAIKETGGVTPNPTGETPTADLETIKIGNTVYKIKGGAEYVELTQAEYDALEDAGEIQADTQYYITDGSGGGASQLSQLSDVNLNNPTDGQIIKYDATLNKWVNANGGGGSSIVVIPGTLNAGETSITFTDARILDDSIVSCATPAGINPVAMTSTTGSVTFYFQSRSNDMVVKAVIF